MDGQTALDIFFCVCVCAMLYANHLAYEHGVWDGAFNQFLPRVRSAMRKYDPDRAKEILGDDE